MTDTPNPVPAPPPAATVVTPGWKTSEFRLKVAAFILTALFASGIIPTTGPVAQVAAIAATMLGALGYTVARSFVKAAGAAVLALALLAGGTQTACGATSKSIEADAKAALVNCTAQQLGAAPGLNLATLVAIANTVAAERAKCMTPAGLDWKCVETDLIAQGRVLGGCALVTMATAGVAPPRLASSLTSVAGPPPGAAELATYCKSVPGTTYHLATGDSPCP